MRLTVTLPILLFCSASVMSYAEDGTQPENCAIINDSYLLAGLPETCTAYGRKSGAAYYAEFRVFESEHYLVFAAAALGYKGTVIRDTNNIKKYLSQFFWVKDQQPKFTRSKSRTVPIRLWTAYARSYDVTLDDQATPCFAFAARGGPVDDNDNAQHAFWAMACKTTSQPFTQDERAEISQNFVIRHHLYTSKE